MLTKSSRFIRALRYVHSLLVTVFLLWVLFIGVNTFLYTLYTVSGNSMYPTFYDREYVLVSMLEYRFHPPQKGDAVVLHYAGDKRVRFLKRIEGIPGDTVQVQNRQITLGPDQYYVVGDNRNHSTDSRVFGPVSRSQIIGRAISIPFFPVPVD